MGTPLEFDTFMSAVIDGKSFARIKSYIDHAKSGPNTKIVAGGTYDDRDHSHMMSRTRVGRGVVQN